MRLRSLKGHYERGVASGFYLITPLMISMSDLISSQSSLSEIHEDALGCISASSWGDEALETAKLSPEHFKIKTYT